MSYERIRGDGTNFPRPLPLLILRPQRVEIGEGFSQDGDDLVDLAAVEPEFRVAVGHSVDRLIFFEPVALEAKPFGQLFDLADQDEVDVLLSQIAFALGTIDGAVFGRFDEVENELSLALRTLEDFR